MDLHADVSKELKYCIPAALLDIVGSIDDSVSKHLEQCSGFEGPRFLKHIRLYVVSRIKQEIFNEAPRKLSELQNRELVELASEYQDAEGIAEDTLRTMRQIELLGR